MLAVAGGKGGSGKTTSALGIASLLATRRRDPIVVETDVDMPNLHLRAGVDDDGVEKLAGGTPVSEAATSSPNLEGVDVIGGAPGAPIRRALRALVTDRPVILDGAAGASERAVLPLRHADTTVVVTTDTPASITDAEKTVRMARAVGTPVIGLVVSRASDVSREIVEATGVPSAVAVPRVEDPVRHPTARVAYSQIIDSWKNT
ncbi:MAG: MinD/ParA family protein [Halodesulfurarchaeum sp.]